MKNRLLFPTVPTLPLLPGLPALRATHGLIITPGLLPKGIRTVTRVISPGTPEVDSGIAHTGPRTVASLSPQPPTRMALAGSPGSPRPRGALRTSIR